MKLYNICKSVALTSLLALTGCHDFEEMNISPYEPIYDPSIIGGTAEGIDIDYTLSDKAFSSLKALESSVGSLFFEYTYNGMYGNHQVTTNLTHDIYAGYWANNDAGFLTKSPTYAYTDGWSKNRWNGFYVNHSIGEYAQLIKTFHFCNPKYYHTAYYITRIYYAFLLSAQTDTYGDIPIEYYVKGAIPPEENVNYTPQQEVYNMIFELLDQSIEGLHNIPESSQYNFGKQDNCYGGDADKWLRFANTLRLRLALRISNVDPALAKLQGEKALADPAGMMRGQEDNMRQLPSFAVKANGSPILYATYFGWSASVALPKELELAYKNESLKDSYTKKEFNEDSKNCYLDPRCEVLWYRPTEFTKLNREKPEESDKDFVGVRNGDLRIGGAQATTIFSPNRANLQTMELNRKIWWTRPRTYAYLGYSESLFLKAEAALRQWKGVDKTPKEYYLEGIRASMNYFEIDADEEGRQKIEDYISHLGGLKAFDGTDREAQLEQIITQKWIAVFPNGNEGWAEVRRTDYPRYMLTPLNGNNSSGEVPDGKLIKRVNYPNSESRNPNKPEYNQGTKVWWDVSDTMEGGEWHRPNNFR